MSDAPKLPKGLPVESFDPGDLVYTAKDMEDMHAQGVREGRAAALREAAEVCAVVAAEAKRMDGLDGDYESGVEAGAEQCCDALRARAESEAGHG